MAKKPLYIYDESNNNVEYYIPGDNVFVNEDHSTTLTEFYEAYRDSSGAVLNADTGRVEIGKSTVVVLDSMGNDLDGSDNNEVDTLFPGKYTYNESGHTIWYHKNPAESETLFFPVDERAIYCNKKTNKLYRFDGTDMVPVGDLDFVRPETVYEELSQYVWQFHNDEGGDNLVHPNQCRILPVESMGSDLDNVDIGEGETPWDLAEQDYGSNAVVLFIDIQDTVGGRPTIKRRAVDGEAEDTALGPVGFNTRYLNRHTGRSYRWYSGAFVEEPTPGSSVSPAAVIPYVGDNGNWWVNGVDTNQKAQGDAGEVVLVDNLDTPDSECGLTALQGYILKREFERLLSHVQSGQTSMFTPNWELDLPEQFLVSFIGYGFTFQGDTLVDEGSRNYTAEIIPRSLYVITGVTVEMDGLHGNRFYTAVKDTNSGRYTVTIERITGNVDIIVSVAHVSIPGGGVPGPGNSSGNSTDDPSTVIDDNPVETND